MQRAYVQVSVHGKEGPLSASVSLHHLHSVVAYDSVHIQWGRRGPEEHDQVGAESSGSYVLRWGRGH